MLDKARSRGFKHLITHNLETRPYPHSQDILAKSSFHCVVCVGVMDFIREPRAFLIHARSMMIQNYQSEDGHTLINSCIGLTLPEKHQHSDLSSFDRKQMEKLLKACGFSVERHERFMGYQDSQSGLVQFYHGWLCTLTEDFQEHEEPTLFGIV